MLERGAEEDETGKPETQRLMVKRKMRMQAREVLDKEDEWSSQDLQEEESFAALFKRRSKDSCGLADFLGQTYASGQCRKF